MTTLAYILSYALALVIGVVIGMIIDKDNTYKIIVRKIKNKGIKGDVDTVLPIKIETAKTVRQTKRVSRKQRRLDRKAKKN